MKKNEKLSNYLKNNLKRFEMPKIGVYLLFNKNELIYVGQSKNVFIRIQSHLKDKTFDSYSFLKCKNINKAINLEKHLIEELKPSLNIQHNIAYIKDLINSSNNMIAVMNNKSCNYKEMLTKRVFFLNDELEYWENLKNPNIS